MMMNEINRYKRKKKTLNQRLLACLPPFFCLFRAPKYKWLFSPSSSLSRIRSTIFCRRILRVEGLAAGPLRTYRPVRARGARRRGSEPEGVGVPEGDLVATDDGNEKSDDGDDRSKLEAG